MHTFAKRGLTLVAALALVAGLGGIARAADTVVQVPLPGLLDGRTVSTLTGGVVVRWTAGAGVDGGGGGNGYMTTAASKSLGQNVKALPDDGKFAADARHPEVVLHYSNAAAADSPQTHPVKGATGFSFNVPVATYSKLFMFVTNAEGSSAIKVTLTYADASTEMVSITVPDYFNDVNANDPTVFILYGNMAKWGGNGNVAEANHHNLDGVEVHPAAGKMLASVRVDKTANGYLVFWGATGIATSAVTIPDGGAVDAGGPTDGGTNATAGTGGGAAGAGGTTGAAGTSGAAGTTGQAGTSGAAGATGQAGTSGGAGTTGAAGTSGGAGTTGAAGTTVPRHTDDAGCGCRTATGNPATSLAGASILAMLVAWGRRRRTGRSRGA